MGDDLKSLRKTPRRFWGPRCRWGLETVTPHSSQEEGPRPVRLQGACPLCSRLPEELFSVLVLFTYFCRSHSHGNPGCQVCFWPCPGCRFTEHSARRCWVLSDWALLLASSCCHDVCRLVFVLLSAHPNLPPVRRNRASSLEGCVHRARAHVSTGGTSGSDLCFRSNQTPCLGPVEISKVFSAHGWACSCACA